MARIEADFRRRRGFTLIELLVVVAIIVALIGILIPAVMHMQANAIRATAVARMTTIRTGLQQYYSEFGFYPPSERSNTYAPLGSGRGSAMMAEAMMGYFPYANDGAGPGGPPGSNDPALGFRKQKGGSGAVYGPYVPPEPAAYKQNSAGVDEAFIDPWGHEILYFRSTRSLPGANLSGVTTIFSTTGAPNCLFYVDECMLQYGGTPNYAVADYNKPAFLSLVSKGGNNNFSGGPVTGSNSFLLISAGLDGIYFTADDIVVGRD